MSDRALTAPGSGTGAFTAPGTHRASQVRDGERVELSDGRRVACMSSGGRHANANVLGGAVLASDPATKGRVGADIGVAFNNDRNLRAPDLATGVEPGFGWQTSAPPLAVEYASVGQDEKELEKKIAELLELGTKILWVVHLTGPLRVDVHERGAAMRTVNAEAELVAPGILDNPVPVRALVEPDAAMAAVLRNFLKPHGARTLEELRATSEAKGKLEGKLEAFLEALEDCGLAPTAEQLATIRGCRDLAALRRWSARVPGAASVAEVLGG